METMSFLWRKCEGVKYMKTNKLKLSIGDEIEITKKETWFVKNIANTGAVYVCAGHGIWDSTTLPFYTSIKIISSGNDVDHKGGEWD